MHQLGGNKIITKEDYLANPCGMASIPYWKTRLISVPKDMLIIHQSNFVDNYQETYNDEPFFRLKHNLYDISVPVLPNGFSLCNIEIKDYAEHINACYSNISVTEAELSGYILRSVYCKNLWLAVKNVINDEIAATGIAELDKEIGEGALEWIQVSQKYHRRGLGSYIVLELLRRIKVQNSARFVTVSGRCEGESVPEKLYRSCGFTGQDVWHILRKRPSRS